MNLLFPAPRKFSLPLSKGQDLVVDFKQKVDGTYTDYVDGTVVRLVIDTTPTAITADAVITGYHAVCRVESEVTDAVRGGVLWRLVLSIDGDPTTERVAINGQVVRADGA